MPRKGKKPSLHLFTGTRTSLSVAGGQRGEAGGDYVDAMRVAAWNAGLDRLPVSPEMRVHALAVVLLLAGERDMEPLSVLEMLADRAPKNLERVAHDQARKGR